MVSGGEQKGMLNNGGQKHPWKVEKTTCESGSAKAKLRVAKLFGLGELEKEAPGRPNKKEAVLKRTASLKDIISPKDNQKEGFSQAESGTGVLTEKRGRPASWTHLR